jgi:hypothetical protein
MSALESASNVLRPPSPQEENISRYFKAKGDYVLSTESSVAASNAGDSIAGKIFGACLARSSARSIMMKDWKPCFWVIEEPNVFMVIYILKMLAFHPT